MALIKCSTPDCLRNISESSVTAVFGLQTAVAKQFALEEPADQEIKAAEKNNRVLILKCLDGHINQYTVNPQNNTYANK